MNCFSLCAGKKYLCKKFKPQLSCNPGLALVGCRADRGSVVVTEAFAFSFTSLLTKHGRARMNSLGINCSFIVIELELGMVGLYGGRKTREPGDKSLEQGGVPTISNHFYCKTLGPRLELVPHPFATVPSLLS